MPHPITQTKQSGFTLIELMVGLALLVILLALGVPSFNEVRNEMQRDNAVRAFLAHAQLARSESIKTSRTATMCVRASATTCGTGTDWSSGWLVYVDSGTILVDQDAFAGLNGMSSNKSKLEFLPNGLMSSGATTITVSPKVSDVKGYTITVNAIGRVAAKEN